ncbi:MAG: RDD family protein, partial [Nocardioidaceae bacterium]|nr:RDD family protein [Nocardioidaceae bacterium]
GLPEEGPGAVAGWGRRFLALVVDWFTSMLVGAVFVGPDVVASSGPKSWVTLGVFFVEASLLTALMGGSFGQLLCRVVVVRLPGRPVSLLRSLLRTALVCLVVPPLVFNRDQRGLHDLAAGTIALRR